MLEDHERYESIWIENSKEFFLKIKKYKKTNEKENKRQCLWLNNKNLAE